MMFFECFSSLAKKKRSWGFPRISCAAPGFGALHAVFVKENRTRGRVQFSVQEIRVAPSFSAHVRWGEHGAPVLTYKVLMLTKFYP
jgi:hypothetical protein